MERRVARVGGGDEERGVAFAALCGARVLLGFSQAATGPVSAMAAAQFVPETQPTGASAIYLAAGSLGAALSPLLQAPFILRAGWRAVLMASAVVGLATAMLWLFLAPQRAERAGTHRDVPMREQVRATARILRNRALLVLSLSHLLHSAVFFVFDFWFFNCLIEARGFSVLASGVWASIPHCMSFAIAPFGRRRRRPAGTPTPADGGMATRGAGLPGDRRDLRAGGGQPPDAHVGHRRVRHLHRLPGHRRGGALDRRRADDGVTPRRHRAPGRPRGIDRTRGRRAREGHRHRGGRAVARRPVLARQGTGDDTQRTAIAFPIPIPTAARSDVGVFLNSGQVIV